MFGVMAFTSRFIRPVLTNFSQCNAPQRTLVTKRLPYGWNKSLFVVTCGSAGLCILYLYRELQKAKSLNAANITSLSSVNNAKIMDFREDLSHLSHRERRFIQFASVELDGKLYMTPQDFLESVIEAEPRPRLKRRSLNNKNLEEFKALTPSLKSSSTRTFRNLGDKGIISYTEYLFLLSILTKPTAGFEIAFKMFDTDGDRKVDMKEFCVLLGVMCAKIFKENLLRGVDPSVLERIFSRHHHPGNDSKTSESGTSEESQTNSKLPDHKAYLSEILQNKNLVPTTILLHLFGKDGRQMIDFEQFSRFMVNLQTEVLELEFLEFSKGLDTITELDFARILLRYTRLSHAGYEEFLKRLVNSNFEEKGITFSEFRDFCSFLNNIEDFAIAMKMYTLADRPISESEFHRAVKISTNTTLSKHVLHTLFLIFDEDGDGKLSYKEFIAIMKDRLQRGLQSNQKPSGWEGFKHCVGQEMKRTL